LQRAIEAFGVPALLYPIAAISGGLMPLFGQAVGHWQEVPRVNPIGPMLSIKQPAEAMRTRQGFAHPA
jgi:hypothetical protein